MAARDGFYPVEKYVVLLGIERTTVLRALPELEAVIRFRKLQLAGVVTTIVGRYLRVSAREKLAVGLTPADCSAAFAEFTITC